MSYKYDVSIILVNYNGKKYIDCLFDSLKELNHEDFSFEVVFVDNDSSDDSVEYLNKKDYSEYLNLKIVKNKENKGFAGGNNEGVLAATGEFIVLLNNDTKVEKDWLSSLYKYIKNDDRIGMANSKLLFFYDFINLNISTKDKVIFNNVIKINNNDYKVDNKFCKNLLNNKDDLTCFGNSEINIPLIDGIEDTVIEFCAEKYNKETDCICIDNSLYPINEDGKVIIKLNSEELKKIKFSLIQNAGSGVNENYDGYDIGFCIKDGLEYQTPYEINNGCGASIILKRQDFIDCGMFDERFFMYYEDTDLSYRIRSTGKKIMFCPQSIVRHIHTGSSTEWSPFFIYHVYRNKLLFIYKNISKIQYFKYFIKQCIDGIRYRNRMKIRGTIDSFYIIVGKSKITYLKSQRNK